MGKLKNILKYLFSSNKKEKKCNLAENKEKTFHPEVEKYRPTIDVLCYSLQIYHSLNEITKCIETLNKYPDVADKIVSDIKERLEDLVPELKESEDERIRKCLLSHFSRYREDEVFLNDILMKDIVSWLEKQGKKGINGNDREIPFSEPKQEWSEDDEKKLNYLIALLQNSTMTNAALSATNEGIEDFLKSLKDRVQLQPKQEWSKEDEQKLNRIYSIIGQAADTHSFSTSCRLIGDKEAIELQEFLKGIKNGNLSQLTQEATNILIDKVCAWIKQNVNKYLYNTGDNDAYIPSCSGKMIEDLKNYIQEESK